MNPLFNSNLFYSSIDIDLYYPPKKYFNGWLHEYKSPSSECSLCVIFNKFSCNINLTINFSTLVDVHFDKPLNLIFTDFNNTLIQCIEYIHQYSSNIDNFF